MITGCLGHPEGAGSAQEKKTLCSIAEFRMQSSLRKLLLLIPLSDLFVASTLAATTTTCRHPSLYHSRAAVVIIIIAKWAHKRT